MLELLLPRLRASSSGLTRTLIYESGNSKKCKQTSPRERRESLRSWLGEELLPCSLVLLARLSQVLVGIFHTYYNGALASLIIIIIFIIITIVVSTL